MVSLVRPEAFIVALRNNLPALNGEEGGGLAEVIGIGKSVIKQLGESSLICLRRQLAWSSVGQVFVGQATSEGCEGSVDKLASDTIQDPLLLVCITPKALHG